MPWTSVLLKLLLATLLGGVVGFERERHNQPAGFRTHIVLCIGSTLLMLVSIHVVKEFAPPGNADPSRIASQVVTGIGFLGAGAILRFGTSVRGLTTAACLWAVAGIGLAVGSGYYAGAVITTGLILLTLVVFDRFEKVFIVGAAYKRLSITSADVPGLIGRLEEILHKHRIGSKQMSISKSLLEGRLEVKAVIKIPETVDLDAFAAEMSAVEGIIELEVE